MVLSRQLSSDEIKILVQMQDFVRDAHAESDSHDYAHVFTVCLYAIEIAKIIPESIDPFVCISGALLHDIGKTNHIFSHIHGIFGATLAEEFLDGIHVDRTIRDAICRIVTRHTPTSKIPPETPEEKVVYDADTLDRLGLMGLLRGFLGKTGSMEHILTKYMEKRKTDYEKLHFKFSKELGDSLHQELIEFLIIFEKRLHQRMANIEDIFTREGLRA